MSDTNQRHEFQARIVALDAAVSAYFAAAHPSLEQVRRPIANALDNARTLLNMKSEREDYFVPFALMFLESAERQFQNTKALIEKYGGPENARAVGGG